MINPDVITNLDKELNSEAESEVNETQLELGFSLDPEPLMMAAENEEAPMSEVLEDVRVDEVDEKDVAQATDIAAAAAAIEAAANTPQNIFFSDVTSLPAVLMDEKLLAELSSIPDKMAFKIGDVAELLSIKQYVLRYWETEFDILKPKKAANNQRMYSRKDVENAFLIRKLLHRDRFSIEGARNAMKALKAQVKKEKEATVVSAKIEGLQDRIDDLIIDIARIKQLFA